MALRAPSARPGVRGGRGSPVPAARVTHTQAEGEEGHLEQAARILCSQPEGGGRGGPPKWQRVHIEHGTLARNGGEPPNQEE